MNFFSWLRSGALHFRAKEKSFARDQGGQVLLLVAVVAMVLVLLIGMVMNYGQVVVKRMQTQTAADAAALAAGHWAARGGNLQQMLNGFHWDINLTLGQIATLSADISFVIATVCYLIPIAGPPIAQTVINIEGRILDVCIRAHKVAANIFKAIQKGIFTAIPFMAFFHANAAAVSNGADSLPQVLANVIRETVFKSSDTNAFEDFLGALPIYTWTLSPGFVPWKDLQLQRMVTPGDFDWEDDAQRGHPFHLSPVQPFTAAMVYWPAQTLPPGSSGLDWKDPFIAPHKGYKYKGDEEGASADDAESEEPEEEEEDDASALASEGKQTIEEITFITAMTSQKGVFGQLLQSAGTTITLYDDPAIGASFIPPTFGLATVRVQGTPLHPGGLYKSGSGYKDLECLPVPFWLYSNPFTTIDRLWNGYEGDWKAVLAPVKIKEVDGKWFGQNH